MKRTKNHHPSAFADAFTGVMLFIITGIMPLVTRMAVRPIPAELQSPLYGMPEQYSDMFSYWKSWFFLVPVFLVLGYYFSDAVTGGKIAFDFKKFFTRPPVIAALVYLLFSLLSAVFSDYPRTAWFGTKDRSEGMFTLFAYILAFFTAMLYLRKKKHLMPVLYGLLFSSLVMGGIGVGQFIGKDFFASWLGQVLVTGTTGRYRITFTQAYGTMFNPNTFGLYTAMLFPFLIIAGAAYWGGGLKQKAVSALLLLAGVLMLGSLFGSRSLGGFMGLAASLITLAVTFSAYYIYHKKMPSLKFITSLLLAVVLGAAALLWVLPVRERAVLMLNRFKTEMAMTDRPRSRTVAFDQDKMLLQKDGVTGAVITFEPNGTGLTVKDPSGHVIEPVSVTENEDESALHQYETESLGTLSFTCYADFFIHSDIYYTTTNGLLLPLTAGGLAIKVDETIPTLGFEGRGLWGSSRGYIWSRSFPVLLRHLFLGSGPDSFVTAFPQPDVYNKQIYLYDPYMIVDKAHSLYIQTGITTGGVSLLALLFLLGHYFISTFLLVLRNAEADRLTKGLRLGALAAVAAFSVSSLATDSTIGSSGVFYVLLGLGYAVNAWTEKTETDRK